MKRPPDMRIHHKVNSGIFTGSVGYDAAVGEYVDLVKTGVIDPTKVRDCCCEI